MSLTVSWQAICLRLVCTVIAGILIGINRDEKGRPAGMRTNVLVCVAASVAMLQANLLMVSVGKAQDSFVVLDLMRLPLGILSGMGFIGGGAILRKGDMVIGVTTAATLWLVTVLGLCFGGGQIGLGFAGLGLALMTLWGLKLLERQIPREHRGTLSITLNQELITEHQIRSHLQASPFHIHKWGISSSPNPNEQTIECELSWRNRAEEPFPPETIYGFLRSAGVICMSWKA